MYMYSLLVHWEIGAVVVVIIW